MRRPLHKTLAAAAMALTASPAMATPILSGARLIGATNVDVHGVAYDVRFQHGSCDAVFGTAACTAPGNFTFSNRTDALAASSALLNQVGITAYAVQGCTNVVMSCSVITPYASFGTGGNVAYSIAYATTAGGTHDATVASYFFSNQQVTDAVWSPVPEPASAVLLLPAAAALLATRRRKRPA